MGSTCEMRWRRNIKQYPEAKQVDGLLIVRIDAPLFFANVPKVKDDLFKYELRAIESHKRRGSKLRYLIVDLSPVTDIDASAIHWFEVRTSDQPVIRLSYFFVS